MGSRNWTSKAEGLYIFRGRGVVPNSQLQHNGDMVRIVATLINRFRPPLTTNKEEDITNSQKMLQLASLTVNPVQVRVQQFGFKTRVKEWVKIDANEEDTIQEFPQLTLQDLWDITFGIYQLKQAKSYTREHLAHNGNYEMFVGREFQDLICVKLQSRHVTCKKYHIWIQYIANGNTSDSVTGWYCTCPNGARHVGCCAHITDAMWYLSFARHDHSLDLSLTHHLPTNILNAADELDSDHEDM